ncbi:hypothetical protein [Cognatilysobacter bugurensis]|uniref:Secreted protein n=1 Tax=Cognatilysobacter bugurensis TaxID=543356 RepID=A0A918SUN8_9GAMM|nr:hypothetical protein [Lysobacter bugurensis]GHA68430.1 hypothetical protein GCM10007067_00330 [Lysobacter bugurensis]
MTMKSATLAIALVTGTLAAAAYPAPARAGDVSSAQLACYVDTYAYDQYQTGFCASVWAPRRATNPTTAVFQVVGLPAGNYYFQWRNLETGGALSCTSSQCTTSIATETRGDGEAMLEVTITDAATGARRTVAAVAHYYDGYN